jgi:K+-sensing histidine kinase KdpD
VAQEAVDVVRHGESTIPVPVQDLILAMSKHVANLKWAVQLLEGKIELRDNLAETQAKALKEPLTELHSTLQKVAETDWGIRRSDKPIFSGAIEVEVDRVDRILSAVDEWYKVQTDPTFVFEREILERAFLSEVVHKVTLELEKNSNNVNVDVRIPEDLQVTTSVDRLVVAITALLDNAIKFSNNEVVAIDADINEDDELWIEITDKGPGLQGKDPNELWKALSHREGPNTEQNKDGLSIGLYMARIMIESLNGTIELSDLEQGGMCASIYLPQRRSGDID